MVYNIQIGRNLSDKKLFGETLLVEKTSPVDVISVFLFLFMVGFDLIAVRWLSGASTGEAIRSPW